MPVPGNGVQAGSVPLDALDAGQVADLLADAAALAGALARQPAAEAACAELAADWAGLADLRPQMRLHRHDDPILRPGRGWGKAPAAPLTMTPITAGVPLT
jgi:hypothetical protein